MTENSCFGAKKGCAGRINFNLYHYAGNNPVKYVDPDGRSPVHFFPSVGWSHHAPQRVFGYFNVYDPASTLLGFNIHGTRIDGNDFTVRIWKGSYGLAGAGCELGLYRSNGASMNRGDLSKLGIVSSSSELYSEFEDGFLLGESREEKASFWTTQFHPLLSVFALKDKLTAKFQLNFDKPESAEKFFNQISDKKEDAEDYFWNGFFKNERVDYYLSEDKKSIIFKYGDLDI